MTKTKKALIIICMIFIAASFTFAQSFGRGKGRLGGYVVDESGKPLEGVLVKIVHEDKVTKFETKSNVKGKWSFLGLGTGTFTINTTMEGYVPSTNIVRVTQLTRTPSVKVVLRKPSKKVVTKNNLGSKLKEAEELFRTKNYDKALIIYKDVLAKKADLYQIIFKIADCYRNKKEDDKALENYNSGIKIALEKKDVQVVAQVYGIIGGMYIKKNDMKKASEYFKKSVKLNPKDETLAYNVAEINFNNHKTDEAIKYYNMAIKLKPTWGTPYIKIGYAYLNKSDMKKAIAMFKKFLELEPNSPNAPAVKSLIKSLKH